MTDHDSYEDLLAQLQPQLAGSLSHRGAKPPSRLPSLGSTPRMTARAAQQGDKPLQEGSDHRSPEDYHEVDDALGEVDDDLGPEERG